MEITRMNEAQRSECRVERVVGPLFVPLRSAYYEAFADGSKTEELRLYGPRWNERTCAVGREVTLSKGYGKRNRMTGRIWKFKRQHGSTFGSTYKAAILDCYGTLDVWMAVIAVTDLRPNVPVQARRRVSDDVAWNRGLGNDIFIALA